MIYLDNGATSFPKPPSVRRAVNRAMLSWTNPGRGGYPAAMAAAEGVYRCREEAARLFDCQPEQVALTSGCTHGLNIAIHSLVRPGGKALISGFEHNAVTRTLYGLGVEQIIAGRKLFDRADTLSRFEDGLKQRPEAAVFTHVSNVFGYILPVAEMGMLCRQYGVPFILDAAQSAGSLEVSLEKLGAAYIAMPGHKGLLGPQGTGLLLCGDLPEPLLRGGTGSDSILQDMPAYLPDRLEAGTLNVPGIAGLEAGIRYVRQLGLRCIANREQRQTARSIRGLRDLGMKVFSGSDQAGVISFLAGEDCQEAAAKLAGQGIAVRAGLHCAPLAHESAGTLESGTVRISFGYNAADVHSDALLKAVSKLKPYVM